jgi:hypothetical protein
VEENAMSFIVRIITDAGITEQKNVHTIEDDGTSVTFRFAADSYSTCHHSNIRHIDVFWNKEK